MSWSRSERTRMFIHAHCCAQRSDCYDQDMRSPSPSEFVGRADIIQIIRSATYFFDTDDHLPVSPIREAEVTGFLRANGRRTSTRLEATRESILAALEVSVSGSHVAVAFNGGRPIVKIETSAVPERIAQEVLLRLRWQFVGAKDAKIEIDRIERERSDLRSQEARRRRDAGRDRINADLPRLRDGIRNVLPLFAVNAWGLREIDDLRGDLQAIETVQENLRSRKHRSGDVDELVRRVLGHFGLYSVFDAPGLLSAIGCFVNSDDCLGALTIRYDFKKRQGSRDRSLDLQLFSGYRPHTDLIKELPRSFYEHPGYLAPAEELFDRLSIDFYAGKRAGDAEDGAVGWLTETIARRLKTSTPELLDSLAAATNYWSVHRLQECVSCWNERVQPILAEG